MWDKIAVGLVKAALWVAKNPKKVLGIVQIGIQVKDVIKGQQDKS